MTRSTWSSRTGTPPSWARCGDATDADVADAVEAAKAAAPALAGAVVRRAGRDLPAGRRPAGRPVAGHAQCGHDARPVARPSYQAEIDAACELIDFWRFNVHFARQILAEQPQSSPGRVEPDGPPPAGGLRLAITPFNFTAIAGNLPTAPALMGNTVVWKPSPTQQLAAHYTMQLLEAAGLPPGVINMVTGDGPAVSEVALADRTWPASTSPARPRRSSSCGHRRRATCVATAAYPRLVGETGGKDFVLAHPSPPTRPCCATALVRGAFEYQGQKCSAASRAYVPRSLWDRGCATTSSPSHRVAADGRRHRPVATSAARSSTDRAFAGSAGVLDRARATTASRSLAGGTVRRQRGLLRPTDGRRGRPTRRTRSSPPSTSGRSWACFVYDDADYDAVLRRSAAVAPYGLTGSVFATDRAAIAEATGVLRFAAGNFYVNDKPTGAVVGQQPFGGARASRHQRQGRLHPRTCMRWVSPAHDQGDLRPADRLPLPAPGLRARPGDLRRRGRRQAVDRSRYRGSRPIQPRYRPTPPPCRTPPGRRPHPPRSPGRAPCAGGDMVGGMADGDRRFGEQGGLLSYGSYLRIRELLTSRSRSPTRRRTTSCCSSPSTRSTSCGSSCCCTSSTTPGPDARRRGLPAAGAAVARSHAIERVLVEQIDVLETMTPQDFLVFRSGSRRPAASSRCSSARSSSCPGEGPGVRRPAARRDRRRAGPAATPARRAVAVGRVPHAAGQAAGFDVADRRASRRVVARRSPRDRGAYGPLWDAGRGAGRARRDVGAVAGPARADGRAADRPEIGHRRVDRRAVPARADRASLLPRAVGSSLGVVSRRRHIRT